MEVEQGHFVIAIAGDGFNAIQAEQSRGVLALQHLSETARNACQRQVTCRLLQAARFGASGQQQMALATARGPGEIQPVAAFAARNGFDCLPDVGVAVEVAELPVGWKLQREWNLWTHARGRLASVGASGVKAASSMTTIDPGSAAAASADCVSTSTTNSAPYNPLRVYCSC